MQGLLFCVWLPTALPFGGFITARGAIFVSADSAFAKCSISLTLGCEQRIQNVSREFEFGAVAEKANRGIQIAFTQNPLSKIKCNYGITPFKGKIGCLTTRRFPSE